VVVVRDVNGEAKVAPIRRAAKLRGSGVRDTPIRVEFVGVETSAGISLEMPATRSFSRQLVAYTAAFLPTVQYFKSNDCRISAVCDDQYSSTLAILEETARSPLTRRSRFT
jgi:hypothetical protein